MALAFKFMCVESAIPNFVIHEHHCCSQFPDVKRLTTKTFDPVNGMFDVPEDPGMGVEWSEEAMKCELQVTVEK